MSPITCTQDTGDPPLIVGDDPETWTTSLWNLQNNALFEDGTFSSSGLIFFYFQNGLGTTARFYVGARGVSGSTTFQYAKGSQETGKDFEIFGARASSTFLQPYVSGGGYSSGSAPSSSFTPRPLFTPITVPDKGLVVGEVSIKNLSASTNFYLYGDDCSPTACPAVTNPAKRDGQKRGGVFPGAHFTITHNYTPALGTSSGGIAWYDIGKTPTASCVPAIAGNDPLGVAGQQGRNLLNDFGVPILIQGTPEGVFEQFWYLNPRANVPYASALWVSNMTDPKTLKAVTPAAYYLPTTAPSAAPQPSTVPDRSHAITLGLDGASDKRTLIYVTSGDDLFPVRFYYIVPAGLSAKKASVK